MTRNAPSVIGRASRSAVVTSLGLALVLALAHPQLLEAATITVGPSCSLVNAIKSANANSDVGGCTGAGPYGADIIVLPFATYALTAIDNGTGADANGLPAITSDITIQGNGSTISRTLGASSPFFRIFEVRDGGILTLMDLTVSGGRVRLPLGVAEGGGIAVRDGQLVLNTVTLSNNAVDVSGGDGQPGGIASGGGIYAGDDARLTVIDSVIIANVVNANGGSGGASVPGAVGSSGGAGGSAGAGGIASGGGIYFDGIGSVLVSGSTITGNLATANGGAGAAGGPGGIALGGGLAFETDVAGLTVVNSTIGSNSATANGGLGATNNGGPGGIADGGGVYFASGGSFDLANSLVTGNAARASGSSGGPNKNGGPGGIASGGGMWIASSILAANNAAPGGGPLVANGSNVTITSASIKSNSAVANGGEAGSGGAGGPGGSVMGGGVEIAGGVPATLSAVSLSQNTATANAGGAISGGSSQGGALALTGGPGAVTLASVTFASNAATANGTQGHADGGALFRTSTGVVTLTNCTLSGNSAASAGGIGEGGGIDGNSGGAAVSLQNTILSGNTAANGPDCTGAGGAITSLGNNIIGTTAGCGVAPLGSDKVGVAPAFGAFVDTGKPASGYFPLSPASPAIDAANAVACPAKDQLLQGRVGGCDMGAVELVPVTPLVAAILPISRSGQVGGTTLTAFVTVINAGGATAFNVGIGPQIQSTATPHGGAIGDSGFLTQAPATFHFQTTDPATNALTGTPDTGADIPPGQFQTYVIAVRPTAAFDPIQLVFDYAGPNTNPVAPVVGLNTLLASASVSPIADVIALSATVNNNGIVDVPGATGTGFFTVASVNLGAGGSITVRPDAGATAPAPSLSICQTNPVTAVCLSPPAATVQTTIGTNETPTFAIFATGNGVIPFDPAVNRISVFFQDAGQIVRGATGVAVRTQ